MTAINIFNDYRVMLDDYYEKFEKIVKISRDITIESKRIIFLLHRITRDQKDNLLKESAKKLQKLEKQEWKLIAKLLHGCESNRFLRAYSPGLQEYIEACSFHHYLEKGELITLQELESRLQFSIESTKSDENESVDLVSGWITIPIMEYLLGIADLTGELMRLAINSVGQSDFQRANEICQFMQVLYDQYLPLADNGKEMNRKFTVMKQSLSKVESVCYNVHIRGKEMPTEEISEALTLE